MERASIITFLWLLGRPASVWEIACALRMDPEDALGVLQVFADLGMVRHYPQALTSGLWASGGLRDAYGMAA